MKPPLPLHRVTKAQLDLAVNPAPATDRCRPWSSIPHTKRNREAKSSPAATSFKASLSMALDRPPSPAPRGTSAQAHPRSLDNSVRFATTPKSVWKPSPAHQTAWDPTGRPAMGNIKSNAQPPSKRSASPWAPLTTPAATLSTEERALRAAANVEILERERLLKTKVGAFLKFRQSSGIITPLGFQ